MLQFQFLKNPEDKHKENRQKHDQDIDQQTNRSPRVRSRVQQSCEKQGKSKFQLADASLHRKHDVSSHGRHDLRQEHLLACHHQSQKPSKERNNSNGLQRSHCKLDLQYQHKLQ